jgi:hypothetical protein
VVTATAIWWNRVHRLLDAHRAYRGSSYRAEESGETGIWVVGQETAGGIVVDE